MLDVKALLTKMLNCLNGTFYIGTYSKAVSLSANGYSSYTLDVNKSGYTPLGIVGIAPSGGGSGSARVAQWEIQSDNYIHFFVWNMSNSSVSWTIWFKVLYAKNW